MAENILLQRMKIDLGIASSTTAYDSRFESLLSAAQKEIERMGIVLDLNETDDGDLVIDYARERWLARRGDHPESGLSRSLQIRINNRLFGKERKSQNPEV